MIHLYTNPDEMPYGLLHIKKKKKGIEWGRVELVAIPHNRSDEVTIEKIFDRYDEKFYYDCFENATYPFGVYVLYRAK